MSTLHVEVWADVVCPWCFIAAGRLEAAVTAYQAEHDSAHVLVRHRAFELDPGMPAGTRVPVAAYLGEKYGGGEAAGRAMTERVAAVAAADGLVLDFARAVKTSTFDAHRMIALARDRGGAPVAEALLRRTFAAHFQEGLALDDHSVLERLAVEVGLADHVVAAALAGEDCAEEVRSDEAAARSLGVSGVPFAVAQGRVAVSRAQPVEVFVSLLEQAAAASAD